MEVLKLDVEGHERDALEGASGLLSKQSIRDIVFEEHRGYRSSTCNLPEANGYSIFGIEQMIRGPQLSPPALAGTSPHAVPNFIATSAPDRLRERMRPRDWQTLKRRV